MKIAFDISLAAEPRTGIGNYITQLTNSLAKIDFTNSYLLYSFFFRNFREKVNSVDIPRCENFVYKPFRFPARLSNHLLRISHISLERLAGPLDIVHITGFNLLPLLHGKLVVTIYDVFPLTHPEIFTQSKSKSFRQFLGRVKEEAKSIIAISNTTKSDLIKLHSFPSYKIKVIPLAPNEIFKPVSDKNLINKTLAKYSLLEPFVLNVGNLTPRKNITRLLEAYERIKRKRKQPKLVIVGQKGWSHGEIFDTVAKLNLSKDVIFLGHIPETDLLHIYNAAILFVYPSLHEGFGLPVLEAMACGTPVITSNVSSLPETAGDAAKLVDPHNVEEIAIAIEGVLEDEELRKKMSQEGLERAKCFSWEKTAKETLNVYREVCERG